MNPQTTAITSNTITPQTPCRESMILQHRALVRTIAKALLPKLPPCVSWDDLVSAGTLGLIGAVDRFAPGRDIHFTTYAKHRVRGAMIDFLRGEDPLSREERARWREAQAENGDSPAVTISLDQGPTQRQTMDRFQTVSALQIGIAVRQARQALSQREDQVMTLLFDYDQSNLDAARLLGVTEGRVSQIKRRALMKLRARLE